MVRLIEPTKVCANANCASMGQRQPWSNFYPRTRWPDGSVRNVVAYCKPCAKARAKAYEKANPERTREKWRQASRRRWQDPERAAIRADYERRYHGRGLKTQPRRYAEMVDAAPFVVWFEYLMRRDDATRQATAERLGVSEKGIRLMQDGEQLTVELSTVERALIADDTITLQELYPDLYAEAGA